MRTKDKDLMKRMVDFINEIYTATGRTPSYREIGAKFNITSACVSNYMQEMQEKGMITIGSGKRSLSTAFMQKGIREMQELGLVGSIACGTPLLAEQNIEAYIPFPKALLGNGDYFILRANGDSMVNAGINDQDLVIIKQQESADEGEIIVALIDDEATLKRFYVDKRKHKIRLHPENEAYSDIFVDNVQIQGVAVKVIKDLF